MKLQTIKYGIFVILSIFAFQAKALVLSPTTACTYTVGGDCVISDITSQPSASDIQAYMDTLTVLEELYKADVADTLHPDDVVSLGIESGPYADFYITSFTDSLGDPSIDPMNALLEFTGTAGDEINCTECYLSVKDGDNNPSLYVFDISGWDGMETIEMTGFWPNQGAISNVAIWGPASVPEPGTLALFGLGLLGLALGRKKVS